MSDDFDQGNITYQITLSENISSDKNTEILINSEKYEDGQHILFEKNRSIDKNTHIEDEKYFDSRLLWRDLYPQVLASCISLLIVIQPGINLAYSNNLLHHMPLLSKGQFSWITSIMALFTPIGALIAGSIMDWIGRKKTCLLTCLPLLMSWTILAVSSSDNVYMFYISRMLSGIGGGMTTVGLVYVSEISHASYKQLLLSLNSVFFSGGVLLSTVLVYVPLRAVNLAFVACTVVNAALVAAYLPESPVWLLRFKSPGHVGRAEAAVKRIYPNNSRAFRAEWKRLRATTTPTSCSSDPPSREPSAPSFVRSLRSSPAAYKPMAIMVALLLLQQLSGAYPIISYGLPVIRTIVAHDGGGPAADDRALVAIGAVRFAASLLTCALSLRVGRRPLLTCSCVGMALSAALVASSTYAAASQLAALCGVIAFVFSSSLGVLVFPWTLVCELLSTPVRAVGGSLLVCYAYVLMFAALKAFPFTLAAFTVPGVFLVYGLASLAMAAYVHVAVPETLGKTFQDIEDHFMRSPDTGRET